ncbi:hypothetical protein EV182_007560 [Spiromyces aspiralis]|uniref:Uncharacterized protein n=1 Tax=Spiromyces aspiralis TaxID=68401 RepID=A0ACC1HD45_9FUNG|nr:hypothetical protein EV182_007560 [Spiromyces aspiralis]
MSWADHSGLIATSSGFDEKEAMDTKGNRVSKLPIYPLTHHYYHQYRHHHHRRHCQQQQQQQHQQQKPMPLASQPTINSTSPLDVFPTGTGRRYTSGHYAAPQPFSSMSRRTSDSVGPANLLLTQSYSFPVMELPGAQCPNADEPGRTCKRRKTMSDMPASNPLDFWVSPFKCK